MKIVGDAALDAAQYQDLIPLAARDWVVCVPGLDDLLGIFSLEITWPVYGPWEVFYYGPKKFRRFMFVHFAPRDAYLQELPNKAEIGMNVYGCILQAAEWMPVKCVAVVGRDG